MTKLNNALELIKRGYAVIPLMHRNKTPEINFLPLVIDPETGKQGRSWEPFKTKLPTEYEVTNWLGSGWLNYGVVAGWKDLTVIDFDNEETFNVWLEYASILFKHAVIETPYMVKTARGAHVYFTTPGIPRVNSKRIGIDIKMNGYVVGAGSTHPTGVEYIAMNEMNFPFLFDLETILPSDIFAPVAVVEAENAVELPPIVPAQTVYDAFQMASSASEGLDLITKVKSSVRIENFFPDARFTSSDKRWMVALCPFHLDHNPSFWIDVRRQLCGCNTCGMKPMDAINLYARKYNVPESQAVNLLAQESGVWG